MITTEKALKDLGFKYCFDYGIKPNHYEIYKRKDMLYFFKELDTGLREEVRHLRVKTLIERMTYDDVKYHKEHGDTMKDIGDLEKKLNVNRICSEDYEEASLE